MSESLLILGVITAVMFLVVLFLEGSARPNYRASYHTGSELTLGNRGWVQVANFVQMGVGTIAFAAGINQTLGTPVAAVLLAIAGLALIMAGTFKPDPLRGYPPNAEPVVTLRGRVHESTGPIMSFGLLAGSLLIASALEGPWRVYTVITAIAGLALTIVTAVSFYRDGAHTGLIQRGLVAVYWTWIALLGIHLATSPPHF